MLFPDAFAAALSDRTTALAAAFIIATRHADVLQFVARTIGVDAPADVEPLSKPRAAAPRGRKANGHRKPRDNAGDRYLTRRRAQRDEDDSNLRAAMRRNTEATIGELATAVGLVRRTLAADRRAAGARADSTVDSAVKGSARAKSARDGVTGIRTPRIPGRVAPVRRARLRAQRRDAPCKP
jgi:hypothetical protein